LAAAWVTGLETGGLDGIRAQNRTSPTTPAKAAADGNMAHHRHDAPLHHHGAPRHQA
jgi:hypothetical protein